MCFGVSFFTASWIMLFVCKLLHWVKLHLLILWKSLQCYGSFQSKHLLLNPIVEVSGSPYQCVMNGHTAKLHSEVCTTSKKVHKIFYTVGATKVHQMDMCWRKCWIKKTETFYKINIKYWTAWGLLVGNKKSFQYWSVSQEPHGGNDKERKDFILWCFSPTFLLAQHSVWTH